MQCCENLLRFEVDSIRQLAASGLVADLNLGAGRVYFGSHPPAALSRIESREATDGFAVLKLPPQSLAGEE